MEEIYGKQLFRHNEALTYSVERSVNRHPMPLPTLGIGDSIGGLNDDDFVVITARGGTGKTWLLMQIARDLAVSGKSVAFFSGEMSLEEIMIQRFAHMSPETKLLSDPKIAPSKKLAHIAKVTDLPIWFPNILEDWKFRTDCIPVMDFLREKFDVDAFFFDHLRYFTNADPASAHAQERLIVEQTVKDMRLYAKKNKTPVFLAVQPKMQDTDTETTIDSMKGTSAISQEATAVLILDRKRKKKVPEGEDNVYESYVNLKVEKARHGRGNSNIKIVLDLSCGRFVDWKNGGAEIVAKSIEKNMKDNMKNVFDS